MESSKRLISMKPRWFPCIWLQAYFSEIYLTIYWMPNGISMLKNRHINPSLPFAYLKPKIGRAGNYIKIDSNTA